MGGWKKIKGSEFLQSILLTIFFSKHFWFITPQVIYKRGGDSFWSEKQLGVIELIKRRKSEAKNDQKKKFPWNIFQDDLYVGWVGALYRSR